MKSSTQLDSVVFQLTPTRTRFELVISANGKSEKMASGLLNPYLAHLKTAQEQMAKGGYSIILRPDPGIDATWFTKGTMERFVRFVSTPEILERVYTVESEILQIEEAIAIQSNNYIGSSAAVEEHHVKPSQSIEGNRATTDSYEEKAIILYAPGTWPPEANGSTVQEGNPKLQLLKVLETRKMVLQKEQGMAFARAVAAGFNIDEMTPLMSFAESFGASRLGDACIKFTELWKRKHETGQWLEIEAISSRSEFSAMKELKETSPGISEKNRKAGVETSTDEKSPIDQQTPDRHGYSVAQFSHPMWPIHSPPGGMPTFQGYPMQGMNYHPHYPGINPLFHQPYSEDQRLDVGQKIQRHHTTELDNKTSISLKSRKKSSRSGRKQSGKVVIQNINYITPKKQNSSDSDSESHSGSEMDEEDGDSVQKNSLRSSKGKGSRTKPVDASNTFDTNEIVSGKETDGGHWQAFQTFLLRGAEEEECRMNQGKRRPNRAGEDPLVIGGRETGQYEERNTTDMHKTSASGSRMLKASSSDQSLISRKGGHSAEGRIFMDGLHYAELDGRRVRRSSTNDYFIVYREQNQSDPLAINGVERPSNSLERRSSNNINDDSYIVPFRPTSVTQVGTDVRNAINMDSEFSSSLQKAQTTSNRVGSQVNYETDDLTMMPERGMERGSIGYDPALDYKMQVHDEDDKNKEGIKGSKNLDIRKPKLIADPSDKRKTVGPIRKGKPSKMSPLDEAKARAERLRTYKADLQKLKKERDEAESRRLEALKMERQKRIAARSSSGPAQSKLSPSYLKGSKFTDAEPGLSSPLQRSVRTKPVVSAVSLKTPKPSKLNTGTNSSGNRLSKSVPSLPVPKKDFGFVTPDAKASMASIRRLSEPKIGSRERVSSVKPRNLEPSFKTKAVRGPAIRKISEIINHDKSKIASLPELKIKTTKVPDTSGGKEMTQKVNGSMSSTTNVTETSKNPDKVSYDINGDDGTVIEKTIVMLERDKPSAPTVNSSEGTASVQKGNDGISTNFQVQKDNVSNTRKESSKFTSSSVTEKPSQAPFARVSSSEDPCNEVSDNSRAPQTRLQAAMTESDSVRAHRADSKNLKLKNITKVQGRPQVKESSKGFRRLLPFGRKNHSSDSVGVNGSSADELVANRASSSEVHTLRNLLSRDENPTASNTPRKSARSFSLLSPFKIKTSEKKLTC